MGLMGLATLAHVALATAAFAGVDSPLAQDAPMSSHSDTQSMGASTRAAMAAHPTASVAALEERLRHLQAEVLPMLEQLR